MLTFIFSWMRWNYNQNTLVKTSGNKSMRVDTFGSLCLPCVAHMALHGYLKCDGGHSMHGFSTLWWSLGLLQREDRDSLYQKPFLGLQKSLGLQPSSAFQYGYNQNGRLCQCWVIVKLHFYRTSFQYECNINSSKQVVAACLLLFHYLNLCLLSQIPIKFRDGYNIFTVSPSQLKQTPVNKSEHWV